MDERPAYSEINEQEMKDLEAEFGRPLNHYLALWLIRQRMNRAAVQRMIREGTEDEPSGAPSNGAEPPSKMRNGEAPIAAWRIQEPPRETPSQIG